MARCIDVWRAGFVVLDADQHNEVYTDYGEVYTYTDYGEVYTDYGEVSRGVAGDDH